VGSEDGKVKTANPCYFAQPSTPWAPERIIRWGSAKTIRLSFFRGVSLSMIHCWSMTCLNHGFSQSTSRRSAVLCHPSVILTKSSLDQADVYSSGVQRASQGTYFRWIRWLIGWVSPFRPISSPFRPLSICQEITVALGLVRVVIALGLVGSSGAFRTRTRTRTRTRSTRWPRSPFVGSSESVATPSVFKRLHHAGWIRHPACVEYEYRCTEYEYEYEYD